MDWLIGNIINKTDMQNLNEAYDQIHEAVDMGEGNYGKDTIPALLAAFEKQMQKSLSQIKVHQSMHDKLKPS